MNVLSPDTKKHNKQQSKFTKFFDERFINSRPKIRFWTVCDINDKIEWMKTKLSMFFIGLESHYVCIFIIPKYMNIVIVVVVTTACVARFEFPRIRWLTQKSLRCHYTRLSFGTYSDTQHSKRGKNVSIWESYIRVLYLNLNVYGNHCSILWNSIDLFLCLFL